VLDPRFSQLLALARNGDESAVSDLWAEFGFDFHAEATPDTGTPEGGSQC